MTYDYDLFVIGAGSGGIATARRAAEYGAKVGIAENDRLGGTCVNRGCVPKKLMVYASHFPVYFEAAVGYGWSKPESTFDWQKMITAVNKEVDRLNGIYQRMLDNSKVELLRAKAKFIDSHTLAVGERQVTAARILIAVGGHPVKPDIPGIEHTITSDEIFHLAEQPEHIVILGGGYIGCEFACILRGLGSKVTQIVRGDNILRGFDQDIRSELSQAMREHGINLLTSTQILEINKTATGLVIKVETPTGKEEIKANSLALAALGRKPRTENLGLENTKVQIGERGEIIVDENNQTSEPHIYAVGDCTDRINLTPVAIKEGRTLADVIFGKKSAKMSYENVPTAVFTNPEAATVGLSEAEAREKYGDRIKIYRSRFRPMFYTLPDMQVKTMMKLVVHTETDKVLGAHMVGDYAAEIIQGVAIAVKMGATKANFDATVAIHPTSAEEFVTMR
ncbi:MAG: glutathione-disulfide reductase [Cyanobacteria bacterium J083]|nr:MAG: glutathione-disulfide reductase [Cyanobacteria bacterium J083]